jgi:transposase
VKKKKYTDEIKEQVVKECREIGNTSLVARRHGIAKGTVYSWVKKAKENGSVKSLPKDSKKKIKEWLLELVTGDGFLYGYRKLTTCLKEDYALKINKKKVYRLCKELDILRPQRKIKKHHPRKLAKRDEIDNSNQLWEMDLNVKSIIMQSKIKRNYYYQKVHLLYFTLFFIMTLED